MCPRNSRRLTHMISTAQIKVALVGFAAIAIVCLIVIFGISGYLYYTGVKTCGSAVNASQLPYFGGRIDPLPADGEIRYAYIRKWGEPGMLLTGKSTAKQFRVYCQQHDCDTFLIDQRSEISWAAKIRIYDANSCNFPVPESNEVVVFQNSNFAGRFVFLGSYIEERGEFIAEILKTAH